MTFTAQELLRRNSIDYIDTRKGKYTTSCPDCSGNYLSVEIKRDGVVWFCHSCQQGKGEKFEQIETTPGLGPIKAVYDYTDESDALLYQVLRFEPLNSPKQFRQRTGPEQDKWSIKGVRIVPFRLPALIEAIACDRIVFIVEGEKDVLTLLTHGIPATCNPMGAGKWWPEFNRILAGANIVVCPDNDAPGREHCDLVCRNLASVAKRLRVLDLAAYWPEIEVSDDVSDWFERGGGSPELLWSLVERAPDFAPSKPNGKGNGLDHHPIIGPTIVYPFPLDETTLPVRNWKVPGLLMAKHLTVLVAPSGSGKSLLTLQVALACATGAPWAGWIPRGKFRCMVINSEDDLDEMRRRLAAAAHKMGIDQRELLDRIALIDSSTTGAIVAKFDVKTKTLVRTPLLDQIVESIRSAQIDICFVDPFAETFEGDENSNSELKWCGMLWREVARRTGCAICLVHHTKKYASGMAGDVDAARGAGALIGIARIVSTLFPMTTSEAEVMLKPEEYEKRGLYLRFDDAKANLNVKSSVTRWFYKDTVRLNNASGDLPGDDVGVLLPWKTDLPMLTNAQILAFFRRVDQGVIDQDGVPTGEFYSMGKGDRNVVDFAQSFFCIATRQVAEKLISGWKKDRKLEVIEYRSARQRKSRRRVISELDPLAPKNVSNARPIEREHQDEMTFE